MSILSGRILALETNKPLSGLIVSLHAGSSSGMPAGERMGLVKNPFKYFTQNLGSIVSDQNGGFHAEIDPKLIAAGSDHPSGLRFMLAVLAPSASKSLTYVVSKPPAERLLYWTELHHLPLGRPETCVIQVSVGKAKELGVPLYREETEEVREHEITEQVPERCRL